MSIACYKKRPGKGRGQSERKKEKRKVRMMN